MTIHLFPHAERTSSGAGYAFSGVTYWGMKKKVSSPKSPLAGDLTGAFADGAILFPLLAALAIQTGMNGAMLLATAGAAYISAGFVFRVPMSVQPLKSVVVSALALGAGAAEIGWSGFAVGVACLALSFCRADRLAAMAPRHLVHGLQAALGIMLMTKGVQGGFSGADMHMQEALPEHAVRAKIVLALVLPQLALTLTNSVVGTHDAARRYFGDKAALVTPARLLRSIGIGNILVAPLGGLPFCHGAGGVTAHVKGGAQSWRMNMIIGGALLGLAAASLLLPVPLIPAYPKILMAALLFATGWFHLYLAVPSWKQAELRWSLVAMGIVALVTQNMLWVLGAGIFCEAFRKLRQKYMTEGT
ncbi:MAG: molybdate transporter family protein [Pseudomonadota bacterium]